MNSLESESTRSVFGLDGIPNTDQHLGLMQFQILTLFGNMLCVVFPKLVFGIDAIPNTDLIQQYALRCVSKHSQSNEFNY